MSDICDDAEAVQKLSIDGARFKQHFGKTPSGSTLRRTCKACNSTPVHRASGELGKEVLACPTCGRKTEPLKSRQLLQTMWNEMN